MAGVAVELCQVNLRAGRDVLLSQADARFAPGRVTLIVGPSGAGKSLLLKAIAGLLDSDGEEVAFSGEVVFGESEPSPPGAPPPRARALRRAEVKRRPPVGLVFQSFALFDELSPLENVAFAAAHAPKSDGSPDEPPAPTPAGLLDELRVPRSVRTSALSGGQRQRLAIARTLAFGPQVVLYDEPTSGLDSTAARRVANLIGGTHRSHPQTSIIVTHDYVSLTAIADAIYLFDPRSKTLRPVPREDWSRLGDLMPEKPADERAADAESDSASPDHPRPRSRSVLNGVGTAARAMFRALEPALVGMSRLAEEVLLLPWSLAPIWRSPAWGLRYLWHYFRLVAEPSAWVYLATAGVIAGFVATYFTFRHFPYAEFTAPVLTEDVLASLGFALYRILSPVLATVLIAARCGAAVASDVGGKSYGQQLDAFRTLGASPRRYLLTNICWAFLLGSPLLALASFVAAKYVSLVVFVAFNPGWDPYFWDQHFHRLLRTPDGGWYHGTGWLLTKILLCAVGIGQIAWHQGARPKTSGRDVSSAITRTILWATLYVLAIHAVMAVLEF